MASPVKVSKHQYMNEPTQQENLTQIRNTFNMAADYFDDPALPFWNYFGQKTVNYLNLQPGNSVLDVCCGSGAATIPAALVVGSTGKVIGVDLADALLELARNKVSQNNLENVELRCADFRELGLPDASFDAVICVFGIFFVADMEAAIRELWRMVRPGGKLILLSWGDRVFEPANTFFRGSVRMVRPDLVQATVPWERIKTPQSFQSLLASVGITKVEILNEATTHPLRTPEDWWTMLMGGGYRGVIEQLNPVMREQIQVKNMTYLHSDNIQALDVDVMWAIASKEA